MTAGAGRVVGGVGWAVHQAAELGSVVARQLDAVDVDIAPSGDDAPVDNGGDQQDRQRDAKADAHVATALLSFLRIVEVRPELFIHLAIAFRLRSAAVAFRCFRHVVPFFLFPGITPLHSPRTPMVHARFPSFPLRAVRALFALYNDLQPNGCLQTNRA